MKETVLIQTRGVNLKLKQAAEKAATKQGFNSLQDSIRVFIAQLASGKVEISINSNIWSITPEMEKEYDQDYQSYIKNPQKQKSFTSSRKLINDLINE